MAKDPAFLFYPGDYLRDTQTLSEKTQVAYDRIMCEHMRNICITKQQLKFFTKRLSEDEKDELMFVLTEHDGCFQIEWVAESIIKRRAYSESRRKNRESKNKKDMKNISKTYDKHMENENEDEIEYRDIKEKFNKICKDLPTIQKITDARRKHIRARIKEYNLQTLYDVFKKVSESKFLTGNNDRKWKADFDWILKPSNFIKILEDKYKSNSTPIKDFMNGQFDEV